MTVMYEYQPKGDRRRTDLIICGLFLLGAMLFLGAYHPEVPYPAVWQLLAMIAFVPAIFLLARFRLTHYTYRVEETEDGKIDFVIVETCGQRIRTVCRIGTDCIRSMTIVTKENKKQLADSCRKQTVYQYVALLFAENKYLLKIEEYGRISYLYILSDEILKEKLISQ